MSNESDFDNFETLPYLKSTNGIDGSKKIYMESRHGFITISSVFTL